MSASFSLRKLWGKRSGKKGKLHKRALENRQGYFEGTASTQEYLVNRGAGDSSIEAQSSDFGVTSPDDVLPPNSLTSPQDELRRTELEHRLQLRRWILLALIVPMAIIPVWLMILLSVPVFDKDSGVSERMQYAYLAAVATDFIGLYYIITRDLFPNGGRKGKRK